jgi:hypothetical protein
MLSKDAFQFALTPDLENVTSISSQRSEAAAACFGVATLARSVSAESSRFTTQHPTPSVSMPSIR